MQAFNWDQTFVTGIVSVDEQHQHLVDMVNQVGDLVLDGRVDEARLQTIFHQLADYARFHFADEERLMEAVDMDPRHAEPHRQHHAEFLKQVLLMWRNRGSVSDPVTGLHDFLAAWLTVHILGEDQVMSRIIERIRAGKSPAQAYEAERVARDPSVAALLSALHSLYRLLSSQNRELANANEQLEEKVRSRTQELLRAEKMASIGRLAAGVAHEINNPVGFVQSNLSSLKEYVDQLFALVDKYESAGGDPAAMAQARSAADLDFLRPDTHDLLAESRTGLERVTKIVQQLKDFSRVDQAEMQDTDLNADLENSLQVAWHELRDRVQVVREYGELPPVRCVPAQINQVFFNLIRNAAQAMDGTGTLTLRSHADSNGVEVSISDTGKGMSTEVMQHIFDPFFTTRPIGKGTGLGLTEAYDIVGKHGGLIDVQSVPGRGSTFRVRLPVNA